MKYLLGIGSQRAGSTLLYKLLDECSDVTMHPVKELHYFDTKYNIRAKKVLVDFSVNQKNRIIKNIIDGQINTISKRLRCELRTNHMLSSISVNNIDYADLYRPLHSDSKCLGEITPEYMLLDEESIVEMRAYVGDATIILLSRDPVERFISAFKLLKLYGKEKSTPDLKNFEQEIIEVFESMPGWVDQQRKLNNTQGAYELYNKHFSNVIYLVYEDILDNPNKFVSKIKDMLPYNFDDSKALDLLNKKINSLGAEISVSQECKEFIKAKL